MTRILITGAAGFIASNLCRFILRTTDWEIVALDRLDPAGALSRLRDCFDDHPSRIVMVHHDLRAAISDVVALEILTGNGTYPVRQFDYVAHLAAGSHVERAQADPIGFLMDNVVGTANLLDFVRMKLAIATGGKFLLFSTDETVGPAPIGVSFKPDARQYPRNCYAASKAGSEMVAMAYAETFGVPTVITRCTNVIGPRGPGLAPGQHPEKFLPILIDRLTSGAPVQIHTVDGVPCSRYYVHVENVASAVVHILSNASCMNGSEGRGIYHIAGDEEASNVRVAELVATVLGATPVLEMVERPPGRLRPDSRYCLDDSGLRALGWAPHIDFESGIRDTVLSYMAPRLAQNDVVDGGDTDPESGGRGGLGAA